MSNPTTVYRGHTISWSDNEDQWACYDLSDKARASPKLSIIKGHIDRMYLAERKENAVRCWELWGDGNRVESVVVEYVERSTDRSLSWRGVPDRITHRVAVVAKRHGWERPARSVENLSRLMPVTDEAEQAWARYKELHAAAERAEKAASDAHAALPRLTIWDITPLVELHQRDNDKGDTK